MPSNPTGQPKRTAAAELAQRDTSRIDAAVLVAERNLSDGSEETTHTLERVKSRAHLEHLSVQGHP